MQGIDPTTLPLRDIHLPGPVSWWPLAPGWWILMLLIFISIALVLFFIRRRRLHRISATYLARQELERIKTDYKLIQNKVVLVKELSELIRRLSISIYKRDEIASLTGQDWLEFLDQSIDNNLFSVGIGRVLIEAPYQDKPDYDSAELIILISSWIESVSRKRKQT